jgi:tRNA G10  N-methylase Trm11
MVQIVPKPNVSFSNLQNPKGKYSSKLYFYTINYPQYEKDLCMLEMKHIFSKCPKEKFIFSNRYIDPARSPFIKHFINVLFTGISLEEIAAKILKNKVSYNNFKVSFIDIGDESIDFHQRRKVESIIGFNIEGYADIHNPKIIIGVTKVCGIWILGELTHNKCKWQLHNQKPYSYCNGLGVRVSRALVNIAIDNDFSCSLVDPCCGIGTVVIEALSIGAKITGYEINPLIAENANKNLEYFGFENRIINGDMHTISDKYDAAIVDLPYGVFSLTTLEDQLAIMRTSKKIAKKSIFVTYDNMENELTSLGFKIVDSCIVSKSKFKRYITICI